MDNNNSNQIFDVEGWPNDVYGFLRGTRSSGLNLWVTFLSGDKVGLNDTKDEKRRRFSDFWEGEQNKMDEEQKWVNEEQEGMNEEKDYYNPYIRLYADCEDWGHGDSMPAAWRQ